MQPIDKIMYAKDYEEQIAENIKTNILDLE